MTRSKKIRLDMVDLPVSSNDDCEESLCEEEVNDGEEEEEKKEEVEEGREEVEQIPSPEATADKKASQPHKRKRDPKTLDPGSPSVKTREGRKQVLRKLLKERGLALREDSRLCEQYLKGGVKMDVTALADIMQEMDWYFKCTGYSELARTTPSVDAKFSSLRRWVVQLYERNKKDGEKAKAEYVTLADGKRPPGSLWQVIDDMLETLEEGESIERGGGWGREFDVDRRLYHA